ncbi:hypothetical protein TNCT_294591 [Trichonephila clavata]|uniref:Uncharacterized protein n=1 Tax=Trichonephila clavata TaxID=2740835 RepID=A0A8X6LY64_TRICU|nr:hypothetical protein TNCT_294591 [Trichonephila clavata]
MAHVYSPSTGNVYYSSCVLFSETSACQTQFLGRFSDYKSTAKRMKMHEDSSTYRECVQTLIRRRRTHVEQILGGQTQNVSGLPISAPHVKGDVEDNSNDG